MIDLTSQVKHGLDGVKKGVSEKCIQSQN